MEETTLGSLEETSQNNSDLRIVLRELIRAHGADAVKRELRSIEAKPVKNPRSRGRPVGPAIDDWPSLREAAAIWRERGRAPVWPALIAVAKSLPRESESNVRRLFGRVSNLSCEEFQRAGIGDFWIAAWDRKIHRMITRAEPRYKQAFIMMILTFGVQNPDPDHDPAFIAIIRRCTPPLTVEAIAIFTKDLKAAKTLPVNLISSDSGYHLSFDDSPREMPPPAEKISSSIFLR
jgi:hypothetical protein